MLKQWLAREERRLALVLDAKQRGISPTFIGISFIDYNRVWTARNESIIDNVAANISTKKPDQEVLESSYDMLAKCHNFSRHYVTKNKISKTILSQGSREILQGARIYQPDSRRGLINAVVFVLDALCLSATLLLAGAAKLLTSVWRLICGGKSVPTWKDIVYTCSGKQTSAKPSWSSTHRLDAPSFCFPGKNLRSSVSQQTFKTPKVSISVTGVSIASRKSEVEIFEHAACVGDLTPSVRSKPAIGKVSFPASVSFLVADDGNNSDAPDFHQIWEIAARTELSANIAQRTNTLLRPESAQQVVSAMNDSCSLDWFNKLVKEKPSVLGTRSFSLHTGVLLATENATYALTRGDVQLFALNSSGMQRIVDLEQQAPLRLAPGEAADKSTKKVLRVPHAGNEGTVLVLATNGSLSNLSLDEKNKLFNWASSQDGQGPLPIEMAELNRVRRDLGPFAAAFAKIMPSLEIAPE